MANTEAYFDSSLLVKLYHPEPGSAETARLASTYTALPLSFIAEMELRNTLRALHGRSVINRRKMEAALDCIDQDCETGRLYRLRLDPIAVEKCAFELSESYTTQFLGRTLDILHVANASTAGCKVFVTSDKRQAKLAQAAALEVDFIDLQQITP